MISALAANESNLSPVVDLIGLFKKLHCRLLLNHAFPDRILKSFRDFTFWDPFLKRGRKGSPLSSPHGSFLCFHVGTSMMPEMTICVFFFGSQLEGGKHPEISRVLRSQIVH